MFQTYPFAYHCPPLSYLRLRLPAIRQVAYRPWHEAQLGRAAAQ